MQPGKTADMHFVNHHVGPRNIGAAIIAPAKSAVDDLALRHAVRAVTPVERQILALAADGVAKMRVAPAQAAV